MPRLLEKNDLSRAVSSLGNCDCVWQEDVSGDGNVVSLALPEMGTYRVFLVKVQDVVKNERGGAASACRDWHDIPVSPLVGEITGIIPDENPNVSYRELMADAICDKHLTGNETLR